MWELEERHLQEKHQLLKQQLKDQYFMQRHQLLKRHEKVRRGCCCRFSLIGDLRRAQRNIVHLKRMRICDVLLIESLFSYLMFFHLSRESKVFDSRFVSAVCVRKTDDLTPLLEKRNKGAQMFPGLVRLVLWG